MFGEGFHMLPKLAVICLLLKGPRILHMHSLQRGDESRCSVRLSGELFPDFVTAFHDSRANRGHCVALQCLKIITGDMVLHLIDLRLEGSTLFDGDDDDGDTSSYKQDK